MNYIHESAQIGENTSFGHNIIMEKNVCIGSDCVIGHNVIIREGSCIGNGVRIDDNVVIGKSPMRSPRSIFKDEAQLKPAVIGDDCLIGTAVIIYKHCIIGKKNLLADHACVRENVTIGDYNIIGRNALVENVVTMGDKNKLESNAYITAFSTIGSNCFVAPGVVTSNDNYMGRDAERHKHFKGVVMHDGSRIGTNATILPGKEIFADGTVAAGAVVTKNVPEKEIWAGNPARKFKNVPDKQLLENNKDK